MQLENIFFFKWNERRIERGREALNSMVCRAYICAHHNLIEILRFLATQIFVKYTKINATTKPLNWFRIRFHHYHLFAIINRIPLFAAWIWFLFGFNTHIHTYSQYLYMYNQCRCHDTFKESQRKYLFQLVLEVAHTNGYDYYCYCVWLFWLWYLRSLLNFCTCISFGSLLLL